MAERPVFQISENAPFYRQINVTFEYNSGFAVSQKQKNIKAIHENYIQMFPGQHVLEISSKSMQEGGDRLSAFSLKKYVPSLQKKISLENIFQSGKFFTEGGPYTDLLEVSPKEAKRDKRLKESGDLIGFTFEGIIYPVVPKTVFYDYIYINALMENSDLQEIIKQYDAFTDIEFNPKKSINCQARAAAIYVSLEKTGRLQEASDFSSYYKMITGKEYVPQKIRPAENRKSSVAEANGTEAAKSEIIQKEFYQEKTAVLSKGDVIMHAKYGKGTVISVDNKIVKVLFEASGEKKLGYDWVVKNCLEQA